MATDHEENLQQRDRAERALRAAGFTYTEGAEEWRPPLGSSASPLLDKIDKLTAQRDQLLAALKTLVESHAGECSDTDRRWALVDARLAISAVKGK